MVLLPFNPLRLDVLRLVLPRASRHATLASDCAYHVLYLGVKGGIFSKEIPYIADNKYGVDRFGERCVRWSDLVGVSVGKNVIMEAL